MHQCEHQQGSHTGVVPARGSAPEGSRSWLLIEYAGPWAEKAAETALPAPLDALVASAAGLDIRVQLIRRPGGRGSGAVFVGSTVGAWLRSAGPSDLDEAALRQLADGAVPEAGVPVGEPLFLVCAHGRRDQCCGRLGGRLARALAADYPVWESTHVGGHMFAANLVILPHGLYYGPVDLPMASAAIEAYRRGEVSARGYRGRAGQDGPAQAAEHAALARAGTLPLHALAVTPS